MAKFIPWKAIKAKRERERGAASAVALDTEPVARRPAAASESPLEPLPPPLVLDASFTAPAVHRGPVEHKVAKCRWCGGPFRRMDEKHWICATGACADRQLAAAMRKAGNDQGPILFLPLPLQIDVDESPIINLLVAGAAGVSKSTGCRFNLYRRCRKIPGYRALLLRCTYGQLQTNHLQFIPSEVKALGDADYKTQPRLTTFHHEDGNDSKIIAGYCDVQADIPGHLGAEYDSVELEEGVTLLPEAISEISARARGSSTARASHEQLGLRAGCVRIWSNPGGRAMRYLVTHYIKKNPSREEFPNYDPAHYGFINCKLEDNPYLSETYAETTLAGLSAARYKQLRFGDWSVLAGAFWETFDPAIHLTTAEPA